MIPELGQVFLIGGLLVSVLLGILPMIGASTGNQRLMKSAGTAAFAQFMLIGSALLAVPCVPGTLRSFRSTPPR